MHKRTFLLTTLLAACGTTTAVANDSAAVAAGTDSIPSLRGARSWLNSPPLDRAAMRGKVVAFHFWTLTCINWLRTVPWLRAWSARYRSEGFELVGIHTPEFEFERVAEHNGDGGPVGVPHPGLPRAAGRPCPPPPGWSAAGGPRTGR